MRGLLAKSFLTPNELGQEFRLQPSSKACQFAWKAFYVSGPVKYA